MAKKDGDDFEFEELDFDDFDSDFGDSHPTKSSKNKKRGVVGEVLAGSVDAVKDIASATTVRKHAEAVVKHALEDEAVYKLSDIRYALSDIQDNIDKELGPIKKNVSNIAKEVSNILPDGKIKNFFGKIRDGLKEDISSSYTETKETLDSFKQSMEQQFSTLNQAVASNNSEITSKLSGATFKITQKQLEITASMRDQDRAYYLKSLELHWKSNSYLEEMVDLNRKHFEVLTKQMEGIIKNTSLPDAVKLHTSELAMQELKKSIASGFFKNINPLTMMTNAINTGISNKLQGLNEGLENVLFPLEMISSMNDPELGGGMGVRGLTQQGMSGLMMLAANYGYGKLLGRVNPNIRKGLSSNIIGAASNPMEWLKSKRVKNGGILGRSFNKLIGFLGENINYREGADKLSGKNLGMPTAFDGLTHTSINMVIPTLLSKIHNELITIRTGGKYSADNELIFDATTGRMVGKGALKQKIRKTLKEKSFKPVVEQGKKLASAIRKTLANVETPKKDKILAGLDKHLIGYINRTGTISPDSLLTNEFLSYYPEDLQLEAADLFKEYINTIRRSGNSGYVYNDFQRMQSAFKGSGAILNAHSYGASGTLLNEMGYSSYFGGETYSNRGKIQGVYDRLGSRKRYGIRSEIGGYDDSDIFEGVNSFQSLKESVKQDYSNIRSGVKSLFDYLPANGDYGTAYKRYAEDLVNEDLTDDLIAMRVQEELDDFAQSDEMQKLKIVDPEQYGKRLEAKEAELSKKYKQVKQNAIRDMIKNVKEQVKETAKKHGISNITDPKERERVTFQFVAQSKSFGRNCKKKLNKALDSSPLGRKLKGAFYKARNKGMKGAGKVKDAIMGNEKVQQALQNEYVQKGVKAFEQGKNSVADNFNRIKKEIDENGYEATAKKYGKQAVDGVVSAGKKVAGAAKYAYENPEEAKDEVKKYVKDKLNDLEKSEAVKKAKEKIDSIKEEKEINSLKEGFVGTIKSIFGFIKRDGNSAKGEGDPNDPIQDNGFISKITGFFSKDKNPDSPDPETDEAVKDAVKEDKKKGDGLEVLEGEEKLKRARLIELRKLGKNRTKEQEKEYYDLILSSVGGGVRGLARFVAAPVSFITSTIWKAFKWVTFDKLLPSIWEFSKMTRGLERKMYGKLFKGIKNVLWELPGTIVKSVISIPQKVTQTTSKILEGFMSIWNLPILAALRSKDMEHVKSVLPKFIVKAGEMAQKGIGIFKDLFSKDENNPNSWRNRLKGFKDRITKRNDDKAKADDKKVSLWDRLKGMFGQFKKFLFNPVTAIVGLLGAVKTGLSSIGGTLLKILTGIGKIVGFGGKLLGGVAKGVGSVVVGGAKLAGKAVKGAASLVGSAASVLTGNPESPKSIAKKITRILETFKRRAVVKLGKKAGGRFALKIAGKIAARAVPIVGWSLLLYDAGKAIKYMTVDGMSLEGAVSKAVLGFDITSDEEPVLDDDGNPIEPDNPEYEAKYAEKLNEKLAEESEKDKENNIKTIEEAKAKWDKKHKEQNEKAAEKKAEKAKAIQQAKEEARKNNIRFLEDRFDKDLDRHKNFLKALEEVDSNQWSVNLKLRINDKEHIYGTFVEPRYFTIYVGTYGDAVWDSATASYTALYLTDYSVKTQTGGPTLYNLHLDDLVTTALDMNKEFLASICSVSTNDLNTLSRDKLRNAVVEFIRAQVTNIQKALIKKAEAKQSRFSGIVKAILGALFGGKSKDGISSINIQSKDYANSKHRQQQQALDNANLHNVSTNDPMRAGTGGYNNQKVNSTVNSKAGKDNRKHMMPIIMAKMQEKGWSKQEQIHFLSQVFHESGGLQFTEEQSPGTQYENRKDLGNTQPGDGPRFKGRGIIQLTGRANYAALDRKLGLNGLLLSKPELVASDPELAVESAFHWWETKKRQSSGFRSALETSDVTTITRGVNGGSNGLSHRTELYNYFVNNYDSIKKEYIGNDNAKPLNVQDKEASSVSSSSSSGDMPVTHDGVRSVGELFENRSTTGVSAGTQQQINAAQNLPMGPNGNSDKANKAADIAAKNAAPVKQSKGKCARAVRVALEAGGYTLPNMPRGSAYMYKSILPAMGFTEINSQSQPQKGDVLVWDRNNSHPHGHIQIFTGSHWVSDWDQRFWGNATRANSFIPSTKSPYGPPHLFRDLSGETQSGDGELKEETAVAQDTDTGESSMGMMAGANSFTLNAESMLKTGGGITGGSGLNIPGFSGVSGITDGFSGIAATADDINGTIDKVKAGSSNFMNTIRTAGSGIGKIASMGDPFSGLTEQFKSTFDMGSKQLDTQQSMDDTLKQILDTLKGNAEDALASTRVQNKKTSSVEMSDNKPLTDPRMKQHPPAVQHSPALVIQRGSSLVQQV